MADLEEGKQAVVQIESPGKTPSIGTPADTQPNTPTPGTRIAQPNKNNDEVNISLRKLAVHIGKLVCVTRTTQANNKNILNNDYLNTGLELLGFWEGAMIISETFKCYNFSALAQFNLLNSSHYHLPLQLMNLCQRMMTLRRKWWRMERLKKLKKNQQSPAMRWEKPLCLFLTRCIGNCLNHHYISICLFLFLFFIMLHSFNNLPTRSLPSPTMMWARLRNRSLKTMAMIPWKQKKQAMES